MNDKTEALYLRNTGNTESNKVSMGFNYLCSEKASLVKNKTVLFKYGCFLIPILQSWGLAEKKVVGVFIISAINHYKGSTGKRGHAKDESPSIIGLSSLVRELFQQVTNAFNLSYLELYNMKLAASYNSIRSVGMLSVMQLICFEHSSVDKKCYETYVRAYVS